MRAFSCPNCSALCFFENSVCLSCGAQLGYDPRTGNLAVVEAGGLIRQRCANADVAGCNWLTEAAQDPLGLCVSCRLTRTRPADDDIVAMAAFAEAEAAKRRLLFQVLDLGLQVTSRAQDPQRGLAFDFLSSRYSKVTTGHEDGIIQMDLAESDDAHREAKRQSLGEAYRTVLGHLRHEIGHYYWMVLVERGGELDGFRELFGDERADYGDALAGHYEGRRPSRGGLGWQAGHISSYATMHPWEDWAETFAHYLHIRDTLQTAAAYGLVVAGPGNVAADLSAAPEAAEGARSFTGILEQWLPLTYALNAVNRSMGSADLYPFTISPPVVAKLTWVHDLVQAAGKASGR